MPGFASIEEDDRVLHANDANANVGGNGANAVGW